MIIPGRVTRRYSQDFASFLPHLQCNPTDVATGGLSLEYSLK